VSESQLHAFSTITGDVLDLGPPTEDYDFILGLGDDIATIAPSLLVFVEPQVLQAWED
jgi:hypothetical protein